jgi:site-specific DNA-cytosine methylase
MQAQTLIQWCRIQQIRKLTPVECERLQGFPDNWTKYGDDGKLISDTQRYKMCGNAVTVPVMEVCTTTQFAPLKKKFNLPSNHNKHKCIY